MTRYAEDEILQMYNRLCDEGDEAVAEGSLFSDDSPVDQWVRSREINDEDLHAYAESVALKIVREVTGTGMLDSNILAARVCAAFQLGFEVAHKRYVSTGMPPISDGG